MSFNKREWSEGYKLSKLQVGQNRTEVGLIDKE